MIAICYQVVYVGGVMNKLTIKYLLYAIGCVFGIVAFGLYGAPFLGTSWLGLSGFEVLKSCSEIGNYISGGNPVLGPIITIALVLAFILTTDIMLCLIIMPVCYYLRKVGKLKKGTANPTSRKVILIIGSLLPLLVNSILLSRCDAVLGDGAIASGVLLFVGVICSTIAEFGFAKYEIKTEQGQADTTNNDTSNGVNTDKPSPQTAEKNNGTNIHEGNVSNDMGLKDQLVELKELLDMELISQEEYESKKKQLLGL